MSRNKSSVVGTRWHALIGLGLAIARRLALQLGGDLTVESALGRGARFSILLPGAKATEQDLAAGAPAAPVLAT